MTLLRRPIYGKARLAPLLSSRRSATLASGGGRMGKCASKSTRFSFRRTSRRSGRAYTSSQEVESNDRRHPFSAAFQLPDVVTCLDACEGHQALCFAGSSDGSILVQDLNEKKRITQVSAHEKEVTKIKCCREHFLTASRDKIIKIWKIGNSHEEAQLNKHALAVTSIDCDEDFTRICSGSRDNSLILWDVQTQSSTQECKISRNLITDVCMSSHMEMIAQTSEDRIVKLWDPRSWQVFHSFPAQMQIQTSCSLSENYCVTTNNGFANEGCEVCLWDLRERKLMQILRGHTETVTCGKFINMHYRFATCSHDGTVKLWQVNKDENDAKLQSSLHLSSGPLSCLSGLNEETLLCGSIESGISMLKISDSKLTY